MGFDPSDPETLEITANKNWISIHPLVLCMVAILGFFVVDEDVLCEKLEAASKHYLERMGLFKFLETPELGASVETKKPPGRREDFAMSAYRNANRRIFENTFFPCVLWTPRL